VRWEGKARRDTAVRKSVCSEHGVKCESLCGGSTPSVLDWAQGDYRAPEEHLLNRGRQTVLTAAALLRVHVFILLDDIECGEPFGCITYVTRRSAVSRT
jgi:hypothetical protein